MPIIKTRQIMKPSKNIIASRLLVSLLSIAMVSPMTTSYVYAQSANQSSAKFSQQQLSALVAPIALYPDPLVSQILMASTYPLEVAEAANWQKQNSNLSGSALDTALQSQTWDPSVKSLVAFPQALQMLGKDLSWTQKLGDAVLAQQSDVMAAIQSMRSKAKQAGNLSSNPQQSVSASGQNIIIEPANPQVIYVPTYNPAVVYGPWPYPAYPPPPPYYPPGYVAGTAMLSFGVGMAVGAALFGGMHWGGGWGGASSITVNNNTFNNFNRTTANAANIHSGSFASGNNWQFNPQHRGNVPYSNSALQNKYGSLSGQASNLDRDQEREQLRQNLNKNGLNNAEQRDASQARQTNGEPQRNQAAEKQDNREGEQREPMRMPEEREGGERFGDGERMGGFRR
jgi:hypothetical protein